MKLFSFVRTIEELYGERRPVALAILSAGLILAPMAAGAQMWEGDLSDDFMDQRNWNPETVPAGGNITIASLGSFGGTVLDSASVNIGDGSIFIGGNTPDSQGYLTIRNGGKLAFGGVGGGLVQMGQTGSGSILVTGIGSSLIVSNMNLAQLGTGTLTVSNGATLTAGRIQATGGFIVGLPEYPMIANINVGDGGEAGTFDVNEITGGVGTATLNFNHATSDFIFRAQLTQIAGHSDSGMPGMSVNHLGSGRTILTGANLRYTGNTNISNGALVFASGGADTVGVMMLGGSVMVGNATLGVGIPGARQAKTLSIAGDLTFSSGSTLEMGLGKPGADLGSPVGSVGDLIIVGGKLKLDGTLNIYDIGDGAGNQGFNFGRYELFRYGSFDGDSNLNIVGSLPNGIPGTLSNDSGNKRIILTVEQALGSNAWWNGGADGIWSNDAESWSGDSSGNPPLFAWNDGTAIFNGTGGTATVAEDVNFAEISFEANGYVIADGGGDIFGKPTDDAQSIVNLNAMSGVTGEIATGLKESRTGLRMRKYNAGTIILSSDDNSWTGGTTIEQGTLQIGNGGNTGVLPGNVINGGTVAFNRSNSYSYGGVISGGGQVRQIGSGATILTSNNSYGGQTTISSGTLQIGSGGAIGSIGAGTVELGAVGTLAFNRSGDYTFGNTITSAAAGAGFLAQRGGGLLSLTGNLSGFTGKLLSENGSILVSGNFGGTADVSDELTVNGIMTGAVTVLDGGTLKGTGRVGGLTVQNGGTLSPGNSIGTLQVAGPLVFQSDATYLVEADNTPAADRVSVTGNVTLGGTVMISASPTDATQWRPLNTYTILSYTGSRVSNSEFDAVETDLAFLTPTLNYGPGVVTMMLDRNDIRFGEIGATPNQTAAGDALQSLGFEHPVAGAGVPLYDQVQGMTVADAQAAFDALSGEVHASMAGMLLDDSRLLRNTVLKQAFAATGQDSGRYWFQAIGHKGSAEGDGVSEFKRDAVGLLMGWDNAISDGAFNIGWALGYHMNASAKADALKSEGEAKNTHVAIYGGTRQDTGLGVRLGLSHTWHEVDIDRTVAFPGYEERTSTSYDGTSLQAFGEVDYRIGLGEMEVAPFVGLSWTRLKTDSFMEADFLSPIGSTAALGASDQEHDASFATLGARGLLSLSSVVRLQGMLGYRRTLSGEDPKVRLGFLDGGQSFEVRGAPIARDAAIADLGIEFALTEKVHVGASYNGQLASDARDHAIEARLVWTLE